MKASFTTLSILSLLNLYFTARVEAVPVFPEQGHARYRRQQPELAQEAPDLLDLTLGPPVVSTAHTHHSSQPRTSIQAGAGWASQNQPLNRRFNNAPFQNAYWPFSSPIGLTVQAQRRTEPNMMPTAWMGHQIQQVPYTHQFWDQSLEANLLQQDLATYQFFPEEPEGLASSSESGTSSQRQGNPHSEEDKRQADLNLDEENIRNEFEERLHDLLLRLKGKRNQIAREKGYKCSKAASAALGKVWEKIRADVYQEGLQDLKRDLAGKYGLCGHALTRIINREEPGGANKVKKVFKNKDKEISRLLLEQAKGNVKDIPYVSDRFNRMVPGISNPNDEKYNIISFQTHDDTQHHDDSSPSSFAVFDNQQTVQQRLPRQDGTHSSHYGASSSFFPGYDNQQPVQLLPIPIVDSSLPLLPGGSFPYSTQGQSGYTYPGQVQGDFQWYPPSSYAQGYYHYRS